MHVFTLLGEPVRLRIVEHLAHHERPVWKLVETVGAEFSIGQSAISKHLRVLREANFVEYREFGLQRHYRLTFDAMDRVDAAVEALFVIWEDRLGWPYDPFLPPPPPKLDRAGRKGLRGRTKAEIEPKEDPYGVRGSWDDDDDDDDPYDPGEAGEVSEASDLGEAGEAGDAREAGEGRGDIAYPADDAGGQWEGGIPFASA